MFVATDPIARTTSSSEHTHGEAGDPPGDRRCGVLNRPVVRTQGLCARWQGSCKTVSDTFVMASSLQVSRAMAYQEVCSNRTEADSFALEDTRARGVRRVQNIAGPEVSSPVRKSESFILHPATGNLRKQYISLQPSVGSFKRELGANLFDFYSAATVRLESRNAIIADASLGSKTSNPK